VKKILGLFLIGMLVCGAAYGAGVVKQEITSIEALSTVGYGSADAGDTSVRLKTEVDGTLHVSITGSATLSSLIVNPLALDVDTTIGTDSSATYFVIDGALDTTTVTSTSTAKSAFIIDMNGTTGTTGEAAVRIDSELTDTAGLYITSPVDGTGTSAIYDDYALLAVSEGAGGAAHFYRDVGTVTKPLVQIFDDNVDSGAHATLAVSTHADATASASCVEITSNNVAYDQPLLKLTQTGVTETNFKKYITLNGNTIWVSDGTTANGALTGVEGDICLNGGSGAGQSAYCNSAGTNWTDMDA